MSLAPERRVGRPRSLAADEAIVSATLALLTELGFEGMSVEAVAERAGVGKATIYRRWGSKQELVAAALASIDDEIELPDTGSTRSDLLELLHAFHRVALAAPFGPSLSRVIIAAAHNPSLMAILRDTVMAQRRRMAREILERGMARGEIRADIDPDIVIDMIIGAILQRVTVECTEIVSLLPLLDELLNVVWRGIAAPGAATA